ncbi:hypothetical protein H310_12292 [Aphanomyces invadans]|uniref:Uncharacterized protein n=1 Tax=Aphanomyces invadans TaxID=157072 RepID=A0A024TIU4_9STRA|nr:hypothetical protein H310_12292 [Aphanomyces invadans]ETV93958.1 hypothetical protein H310_12292 [Aphanomyces invadans]|eukprot:XP_008877518.1 hypothetical protein H310_12292 [Aphanomyces invadans]
MHASADGHTGPDVELGRVEGPRALSLDQINCHRHTSMDSDDDCRPRDSTWLYRSTQDAESLANLDGLDWAELRGTDVDTSTMPRTFSRTSCAAIVHDCPLPKLKKHPSKSNVVDAMLPKAHPKQIFVQQWTTCVTPVPGKEMIQSHAAAPLIPVGWVVGSVAAVSSTLVGAALFHADDLRSSLSLDAFPRATLILVVHVALGALSFVGGVVGDRAVHRMHVVRPSVWLWCVGTLFLTVAGHPFVASRRLYTAGLVLVFISSGGLLPNLVATSSLGPTFLHCALAQLSATSIIHGLFNALVAASTAAYVVLAVLAALSTATLVGMHMTIYRRWLDPAPTNLASLGVYISGIPLLWRGYLAGVAGMVLGGALCAMSLICSHDDVHLYGKQFAVATGGVVLVVLGWLWTIFWGVAMVHPSGALRAWAVAPPPPADLVSPASPDKDSLPSEPEVAPVSPMECMAPTLALVVFSSFVRGQLYAMYVLQACQCSLQLVGDVTYNPEYTAVVTHVIALAVAPGIPRLFPRLPSRLGLAMLLYLMASFMSGIVELYRRSSSRFSDADLVDRTGPPTCHKNPSAYSIIWTGPQLALMGISEAIVQTTMGYVVHSAWPPTFQGLGHGLLALCNAVGYATALGMSIIVIHWYTAPAPADLVLVFLLVTSMGCAVIACMKRLLVLDEHHRIWPNMMSST